jgi:hypothetical protein
VYSDVGTNFRADLGFMPRVDYRFGEVGANYAWNATATSWYSKIDLEFELNHSEDQTGILLDEEAEVQLTIQGPLESFVVVQPSHRREGYGGKEFEMNGLALSLSLKPNRDLQAWIALAAGGQVDYTNVQQGDAANLDLGLVYRLGRHLRFEAENLHETMEVDRGWLYRANIAQFEGTWHRCADLHSRHPQTSRTITTQSSRTPARRPSSTRSCCSRTRSTAHRRLGRFSEDSLGDATYDITTASRSIFAKLGYAWVP